MSKSEAILHAAGVAQTAHNLMQELKCDTLDKQEVRTWLAWLEEELAELKKALGEETAMTIDRKELLDNIDDWEFPSAAARLALRLVLAIDDRDQDTVSDLMMRIYDLMTAYANSKSGKLLARVPNLLMVAAVSKVALLIADEPHLRAAVATYLASEEDNDMPRRH